MTSLTEYAHLIIDKNFILFASQPYAFSILRPLQSEIRKQGYQAYWFVTGENSQYLQSDEQRVLDLAAVKRLNPVAVFSASNWVPLVFPGLKVQLFHGFNVEKRDARKGHFRIRGMFDLYCTQGPSTTEPFIQLAHKYGYFKVAETGWCKMDPLFQPNKGRRISFESSEKPVIMFASTFTESLTAAPHLFPEISRLIKEESYNWLLTLHPKMHESIVAQFQSLESHNAKYLDSTHTIDMLKSADVMVSDTSSIISEFLLQDKPVVTYKARRPAAHLQNFSDARELDSQLIKVLKKPEKLMSAIRQFNTTNHPYKDGLSSQRILEAVLNFDSLCPGLQKKRPINIIRKTEHYFKIQNLSRSQKQQNISP